MAFLSPRLLSHFLKKPSVRLPRHHKKPIKRDYAQTAYRPKVGHLVSLLGLAAVSATSYGLWLYYNSFQTWPASVRKPLRAALRSQEQGAFDYSERFYREALAAANAVPESGPEAFGSDQRKLKITGIAVALAGMLEQAHKIGPALEIYEDVFEQLSEEKDERLMVRAVGVAQKIGELASTIDTPGAMTKAEQHLEWAVTQLLKVSSTDAQRESAKARFAKGQQDAGLDMQDLKLPAWVSSVDLGASMENLGNFYLSQKNAEYAIPLFSQVLKILLPRKLPGVPTPTFSDRCHSGTISNNLSSAYALEPTTQNLQAAMQWAHNAVHISSHTMKDAEQQGKQDEAIECGPCLAVGQFNLGLLKEMSKSREEAIEWYTKSLATSKSIRFVEGARQAGAALQRINR